MNQMDNDYLKHSYIGVAKAWGDNSKRIIYLNEVNEMKSSDIAREVGVSVEHVGVILRRYREVKKEAEFFANNPPALHYDFTEIKPHRAAIRRLHKQGYVVKQIQEYLSEVCGVSVSDQTISNYVESL